MMILSANDMEQNFEVALDFVLKAGEPCVDNLENRSPGQRFMGIGRQASPEWAGWFILDKTAHAWPAGGVAELDPALRGLVRSFYRAAYWLGVCADTMPGPLAVALFDTAVVHGRNRAVRFLQEALNTMSGERRLDVDGIFRRDSRQALQAILGRHDCFLTLMVEELLRIRQGHCDAVACGDRKAAVRCRARVASLLTLAERVPSLSGSVCARSRTCLDLTC